jgi:hypothetical protein
MKKDTLVKILIDYYSDFSKNGEKSLAPIAFGYDYAEEIGTSASRICEEAFGNKSSYGVEVRKGMNLRKFHERRKWKTTMDSFQRKNRKGF